MKRNFDSIHQEHDQSNVEDLRKASQDDTQTGKKLAKSMDSYSQDANGFIGEARSLWLPASSEAQEAQIDETNFFVSIPIDPPGNNSQERSGDSHPKGWIDKEDNNLQLVQEYCTNNCIGEIVSTENTENEIRHLHKCHNSQQLIIPSFQLVNTNVEQVINGANERKEFSFFDNLDILTKLLEHLVYSPKDYIKMKILSKDFYNTIDSYDKYFRINMDSIQITTPVFDFLFYRFVWILKKRFPDAIIDYPWNDESKEYLHKYIIPKKDNFIRFHIQTPKQQEEMITIMKIGRKQLIEREQNDPNNERILYYSEYCIDNDISCRTYWFTNEEPNLVETIHFGSPKPKNEPRKRFGDFDGTIRDTLKCKYLCINTDGYIYDKSRKNVIGHISMETPQSLYDETGALLTNGKILKSVNPSLKQKYKSIKEDRDAKKKELKKQKQLEKAMLQKTKKPRKKNVVNQ